MTALVKLIGIVILVVGVIYFVKPAVMKQLIDYISKEPKLKIGGILGILIGIIFLRAASRCSVSWIVFLFGLFAIVKGVLTFVLEKKKVMSILDWFAKKPLEAVRKLALIYIALGVALIYAA